MRVHRALITALSTVALATIGTATSASAYTPPEVTTEYACDGDAFITVNMIGNDTYDVYIDGNLVDEDVTFSQSGPHPDGFRHIVVKLFDSSTVVYDELFPVSCGDPVTDFDSTCDEDGNHLLLLIVDNKTTTYDIYVDGNIVEGMAGREDTHGYENLGVYPAGPHTIGIDWLDDETKDFYDEATLTLQECGSTPTTDGSQSGAGLPTTGSSSGSLALVATLLLAAGATLLVVRRTRTA